MNQPDYIEQRDNGYGILGTRVSLDSVVYRFLEGLSPETIQADCFPALSLDQVYGAISYYLTNRAEIDRYLQESDKDSRRFGNVTGLIILRLTADWTPFWKRRSERSHKLSHCLLLVSRPAHAFEVVSENDQSSSMRTSPSTRSRSIRQPSRSSIPSRGSQPDGPAMTETRCSTENQTTVASNTSATMTL